MSQVLATAGLVAGRHVRGLDQTGLAQKGGAVVSDVEDQPSVARGRRAGRPRASATSTSAPTCWSPPSPRTSPPPRPWRTVAAISSAKVPTGAMVVDPSVSFPDADAVLERITERVRKDAGVVARRPRAEPRRCSATTSSRSRCCSARPSRPARCRCPPRRSRRRSRSTAPRWRRTCRRSGGAARPSPSRRRFAAVVAAATGTGPDTGVPGPGRARRRGGGARSSRRSVPRRAASWRAWSVSGCPSSSPTRTRTTRAQYAVVVRGHAWTPTRASPRPSPPGCTSSWRTRTSTRSRGSRSTRRSRPRSARSSATAPGTRGSSTRRCCGRSGCSARSRSGRWFRPGYRTLRAMRRLRGTRLDPFGVAEVRRVERELVAEYRSLIPTLLTLDDGDDRPRRRDRRPAGHGAGLRADQARQRRPLPRPAGRAAAMTAPS